MKIIEERAVRMPTRTREIVVRKIYTLRTSHATTTGRKRVADQLAIAFAFINLGYRQSLHQMKLSLALHHRQQRWRNLSA